MSTKQHYLIAYAWRHKGASSWDFANEVTAQTPADWLLESLALDDMKVVFISATPISKADNLLLKDQL